VLGLAISMDSSLRVTAAADDKYLRLSANGMQLRALKKPGDAFSIKNDFGTAIK
jgi:hypothetical protein